ncbi:hypothetical protein NN561_005528 [Cricetulus griseus]
MGTSKGAPTRNTDPIAREKNLVSFHCRNRATSKTTISGPRLVLVPEGGFDSGCPALAVGDLVEAGEAMGRTCGKRTLMLCLAHRRLGPADLVHRSSSPWSAALSSAPWAKGQSPGKTEQLLEGAVCSVSQHLQEQFPELKLPGVLILPLPVHLCPEGPFQMDTNCGGCTLLAAPMPQGPEDLLLKALIDKDLSVFRSSWSRALAHQCNLNAASLAPRRMRVNVVKMKEDL